MKWNSSVFYTMDVFSACANLIENSVMYWYMTFQLTGDTPLHIASKAGHKQVAELLLSRGAVLTTINKVSANDVTFTYLGSKNQCNLWIKVYHCSVYHKKVNDWLVRPSMDKICLLARQSPSQSIDTVCSRNKV